MPHKIYIPKSLKKLILTSVSSLNSWNDEHYTCMYTSVQNFFFQKTIFKKICIVLGVHCIFCGACSTKFGDDGRMVNAELLLRTGQVFLLYLLS